MPQTAFLFSIAGLSVTLSGFSGLVAAFRRGGEWKGIDAYRLRQIPEMGLATALLVLATIPLSETVRSASVAIQLAALVAVVFTFSHGVVLLIRARRQALKLTPGNFAFALVIDVTILALGATAIVVGSPTAFEWLLVSMLARPMLAFVLALTELPKVP